MISITPVASNIGLKRQQNVSAPNYSNNVIPVAKSSQKSKTNVNFTSHEILGFIDPNNPLTWLIGAIVIIGGGFALTRGGRARVGKVIDSMASEAENSYRNPSNAGSWGNSGGAEL